MEKRKNPDWMRQESQSSSCSYPGNTVGYSQGSVRDGYGQITTNVSHGCSGYFGDPYMSSHGNTVDFMQQTSGGRNLHETDLHEEYQQRSEMVGCGQVSTGVSQGTCGYYGDPYPFTQASSSEIMKRFSQKTVTVRKEQQYQLESSPLYDTIKENTKEKKTMSYVGILRSDKGLVAFSDSRSTYVDHGKQALESDDVKKVFVSKHFLFVTYGVNKVFHEQGKTERLEVVLDKLLKDFSGSHRDFFWKLQRKLDLKTSNVEYHFIIGFKDGNDYGMEYCALSANGAQFSNLTYTSGSITGGERSYGPMDLSFPSSLSVEKMKELAKMAVTHAIEMGDLCLSYNPVGGAVQIAALV